MVASIPAGAGANHGRRHASLLCVSLWHRGLGHAAYAKTTIIKRFSQAAAQLPWRPSLPPLWKKSSPTPPTRLQADDDVVGGAAGHLGGAGAALPHDAAEHSHSDTAQSQLRPWRESHCGPQGMPRHTPQALWGQQAVWPTTVHSLCWGGGGGYAWRAYKLSPSVHSCRGDS